MASPAGPQFIQVIDTTGPQVGATLEYQTTGGAAQAVYSDSTLLTSLGATLSGANASDSKGRFPIHWLDPSLSYKRIIKLSDGSTWRTDNPVQTADTSIATALAGYVPIAGNVTTTGPINFNEGAAVASAATINLNTASGLWLHVTGTTGISAMTLTAGWRLLVFDAAVTLTHSSNLILPGSADITTVAGDSCLVVGEGGGVTRMVAYWCGDGKPLLEPAEILVAVGDEGTAITTGTAKITFRMPFAMTLDAIPRGSLTTAQPSGSIFTVDINDGGTTILSTKLTIDNSELTSTTAATPAVLADTALADDAQITIDVAQIGTSGATGLKILLRGYRRNRS
jgi:hypothetical protein